MLYIFGGLPGTGKSALALHLARKQQAVYLRIDTIETALRQAGGTVSGAEGYTVAYHIAEDNLRLGRRVVADSVNPLQVTRTAWRGVAINVGAPYIEIEVICSDEAEHRNRVESRSTDIPDFKLPTWEEVVNRHYEPWKDEHIIIDTAGKKQEQSETGLMRILVGLQGNSR
jgi:predicted kinase